MTTVVDLLAAAFENGSGGWMSSPESHLESAARRVAARPPSGEVLSEMALVASKSQAFARALGHGGRTYYGCGLTLVERRYPSLNTYLNQLFESEA